jgi:hypothetical protein
MRGNKLFESLNPRHRRDMSHNSLHFDNPVAAKTSEGCTASAIAKSLPITLYFCLAIRWESDMR